MSAWTTGTADEGRTLPEQVIIGEGPRPRLVWPWFLAAGAGFLFLVLRRK